MKKLIIVVMAFTFISLIGCGTTSMYRCDNYVGVEKDACMSQTRIDQDSMVRNGNLRYISL